MPSVQPAAVSPHILEWQEHDQPCRALWRDQHGTPPLRLQAADDTLSADAAYRLISQGTALVWRGDYHNARQLLKALASRVDRRQQQPRRNDATAQTPQSQFHQHRLRQSQRAQILNRLLIPVEADGTIALRRAPDLGEACRAALGPAGQPELIPLRALQGYVGAWEWQKKGIEIAGLPARIHVPHGVYSPIRGEYLPLLANAPLPPGARSAFDIGTGSGVLSALLLQRGLERVVGTDLNPRALACARDNLARMGHADTFQAVACDLFPPGRADLIVCNPPWLPSKPTSQIEQAVYDPGHRMLLGFLQGVPHHLENGGQAWLILSDLAEHLGLRTPQMLPEAFAQAGLRVIGRSDTRPFHPKALDRNDPLYEARCQETTTLWRLAIA